MNPFRAFRQPLAAMFGVSLVALSLVATSCSNMNENPLKSNIMPSDSSSVVMRDGSLNVYRLASDPRLAVVLEAYRALDPCYCGTSSKSINGSLVGDWNAVMDPWDGLGGYRWVKSAYGSYLSVFASAYSDPAGYGFMGGYGRGFQCKAFVNYILYRSGVYQKVLPTYAQGYADYHGARSFTKPFSQIRVGDVIQTFDSNGHVAIVTRILAGVEGVSVTSVEVLDSNFVGGAGKEIIGKHTISTSGSGYGNLGKYYALKLY